MPFDDVYRLAEPFDIGDGSLDGFAREDCFLMGVEWAEFRRRLLGGAPFSVVLLPGSAPRCVAMAERHGRYNEMHPVEGEDRILLLVGGAGA